MQKKRPGRFDERVIRTAVEAIRESVVRFLDGEHPDEIDSALDDIVSAADFTEDTYQITRNLEDAGWYGGDALYELVDELPMHRLQAHRDAVRAWVKRTGQVPSHAVGDTVTFHSAFDRRDFTGEVVKVNPEEMTYTVFVEELGHVREGVGTHGRIVPAEDVLNT